MTTIHETQIPHVVLDGVPFADCSVCDGAGEVYAGRNRDGVVETDRCSWCYGTGLVELVECPWDEDGTCGLLVDPVTAVCQHGPQGCDVHAVTLCESCGDGFADDVAAGDF